MGSLVCLLGAGVGSLSQASEAETKAKSKDVQVFTEEWPPVSYFDVNSQRAEGVGVEIVRAIQNEIGSTSKIHSEIQVVPWARGHKTLQSSPHTMLFAMIDTEERQKLFHLVGPIVQGETAFFARSESKLSMKDINALKNLTVTAYRDSAFETKLRELQFKNIEVSKDPLMGLRMLLAGRVDLFFDDVIVVKELMRKNKLREKSISKVWVLEKIDLYLGFSKSTPKETVDIWAQGLKKIKANGKYTEIYKKWFPDVEPNLKVEIKSK